MPITPLIGSIGCLGGGARRGQLCSALHDPFFDGLIDFGQTAQSLLSFRLGRLQRLVLHLQFDLMDLQLVQGPSCLLLGQRRGQRHRRRLAFGATAQFGNKVIGVFTCHAIHPASA
jgi:hypothetical protein